MSWSVSSKGLNRHATIAALEAQIQAIPRLHNVEEQLKSQACALVLATVGSQSPGNLIDVEVVGSASVGNGDDHTQSLFIKISAVFPPPPPPEEPKPKKKKA